MLGYRSFAVLRARAPRLLCMFGLGPVATFRADAAINRFRSEADIQPGALVSTRLVDVCPKVSRHVELEMPMPSSVHAFRADKERERVDFEVAQQVASEHPEPLLLCLVGKLFTFLRALELEFPDVLQVVNHFMNED
jgi:hypothetical protein